MLAEALTCQSKIKLNCKINIRSGRAGLLRISSVALHYRPLCFEIMQHVTPDFRARIICLQNFVNIFTLVDDVTQHHQFSRITHASIIYCEKKLKDSTKTLKRISRAPLGKHFYCYL